MLAIVLTMMGIALIIITTTISNPITAAAIEEKQKEWISEWWQWVFSINDVNVFQDPDGGIITNYQPHDDDEVYFLTGAVNTTTTRTVVIPSNKAILLPLYNGIQYCSNCNMLDRLFDARDKLIEISNSSGKVDYLEARLDGKLIPYHEIKSELFEITIRGGNALNYTGTDIGKTVPAAADGYWVILNPYELSVGNHTLYTNGIAKDGYTSEVTYNMEIVPPPPPAPPAWREAAAAK